MTVGHPDSNAFPFPAVAVTASGRQPGGDTLALGRFRGRYTVVAPVVGMDKRSLAASLLLGGIALVGLFHTVLAFVFDTGLEQIGLLVAVTCLVGIALVNIRP
jgi:hypothetical protein